METGKITVIKESQLRNFSIHYHLDTVPALFDVTNVQAINAEEAIEKMSFKGVVIDEVYCEEVKEKT